MVKVTAKKKKKKRREREKESTSSYFSQEITWKTCGQCEENLVLSETWQIGLFVSDAPRSSIPDINCLSKSSLRETSVFCKISTAPQKRALPEGNKDMVKIDSNTIYGKEFRKDNLVGFMRSVFSLNGTSLGKRAFSWYRNGMVVVYASISSSFVW